MRDIGGIETNITLQLMIEKKHWDRLKLSGVSDSHKFKAVKLIKRLNNEYIYMGENFSIYGTSFFCPTWNIFSVQVKFAL